MLLLTFFIGLIANFVGYIPPGNINLTVVRITINRGLKQALQFIISFSCVEFFFTYFIMHAARWLSAQVKLDVVIDWIMVVLFGVLGTITWLNRKKAPKTNVSEHDSIKYGILLGFLNPMQVPFWMITGTYLITHQWILDGRIDLIIFSIGSAGGAFLCLFLYAKFAKFIQGKFALSTRVINTAIAILFFAFAAYHVVKQAYLVFNPKKVKVEAVAVINGDQLLKGEWGIYEEIFRHQVGNSTTEQKVSCNVCPKISFNDHHNGYIKTPGQETLMFSWTINNDKLVFRNKRSKSVFNDGTYNVIGDKKAATQEVDLIDTIKKIQYILRR